MIELRKWRRDVITERRELRRARKLLRPLRGLDKPVVYVSGCQHSVSDSGRRLLESLRRDDEIALIWWDHDFPGYAAIREMVAASDVFVALADDDWLSATHTVVQMCFADGTMSFSKTIRPLAEPIPVLLYPVTPVEQWPSLWPHLVQRRRSNRVLTADPNAAYAEIKSTIAAVHLQRPAAGKHG